MPPGRHLFNERTPEGEKSHDFCWALGEGIEENLTVTLGQHAAVEHHDDALIALGANEPANTLPEFQHSNW